MNTLNDYMYFQLRFTGGFEVLGFPGSRNQSANRKFGVVFINICDDLLTIIINRCLKVIRFPCIFIFYCFRLQQQTVDRPRDFLICSNLFRPLCGIKLNQWWEWTVYYSSKQMFHFAENSHWQGKIWREVLNIQLYIMRFLILNMMEQSTFKNRP